MSIISTNLLFNIHSVTILIIGVITSSFFYYILRNSDGTQRVTAQYFMLHFALTTLGFLAIVLSIAGFEALPKVTNNVLYLLATYSLWHGLAYREGHQKKMWQNKWMYINILIIIRVNYYIFYQLHDNTEMRSIIALTNMSLVMLSFIFIFSKYLYKVNKPADSIVKLMVILMPFLNMSLLLLIVFDRFDLYFIAIISSQVLQGFAWAMALAIILLLDSNDKHYIDSITDKLSGLYNRQYFKKKVVDLIAQAPYQNYAVMMCDIDDFRTINDKYGYQVGNAIIQKVAECLQQALQEDYLICRFGDDQFLVFFSPDRWGHSKEETVQKAEILLHKIADLSVATDDDKPVQTTVSIGLFYTQADEAIKINNGGANAYDTYFKQAEDALYQAKDSGKNKVCVI